MRFVVDARYAGPHPSGIGAYVRAVGERLPALGSGERFHFWLSPGAAPISNDDRVTHRVVTHGPSSLATLAGPGFLDDVAADDVFHAPSNVLGFNLPCRAIVTVHDVMWIKHLAWCQPRPWLRPISGAYFGVGIRRALRRAARVLTVSNASADEIRSVDPSVADRIRVIPNAHDSHFRPPDSLERARALASETLGFTEPFFLVVGQNQPSKGHALALEAFAAAGLTGHRLVLVQRLEVGRGLHRIASRLGIADRVHFSGSVPIDRLVAMYQSATALLQPSLAEGFGLPVLEAMACGSLVIAHAIPALVEVVAGGGHLVPTGDQSALVAALRKAASEPSWVRELGQRGIERARDFSWDRTAALTWEAYREVAADRVTSRPPSSRTPESPRRMPST